MVRLNLHREIRYITRLAQAGDSRLVLLAKLLLFSTATRDAWLLDIEDNSALCLCDGGQPQIFSILETPDTLVIEWPAAFEIRGSEFIVRNKSGSVIVKSDYPTPEIVAAIRIAR
jgi:hypothetical protein